MSSLKGKPHKFENHTIKTKMCVSKEKNFGFDMCLTLRSSAKRWVIFLWGVKTILFSTLIDNGGLNPYKIVVKVKVENGCLYPIEEEPTLKTKLLKAYAHAKTMILLLSKTRIFEHV